MKIKGYLVGSVRFRNSSGVYKEIQSYDVDDGAYINISYTSLIGGKYAIEITRSEEPYATESMMIRGLRPKGNLD